MDDSRIWYELLVPVADRPRVPLPDGFAVERVPAERSGALAAEFAGLRPTELRKFHEASQLWVVREGDRLAFLCWVFFGRTRVLGAPGGWLDLPEDAVCIEVSVECAAYLRRGIGSSGVCAIGDRLATQGIRRILAEIRVENIPSRTGAVKLGFREIAERRVTRRGLSQWVSVRALDEAASRFLLLT
jgi:hypothetical protein